MKLSSVRHLTAGGFRNIWVNRLMSLASVGVLVACMSIIGLAIIVSLNVEKALGEIEKQNIVMVYFNDKNSVIYGKAGDGALSIPTENAGEDEQPVTDVPDSAYLIHNEEEARALCDKIAKIENVLNVEYVSKEQSLQSIKASMLDAQAEYFNFIDDDNPLSDGARVTLGDMSVFRETVEKIRNVPGVDTVQSQEDIAETITAVKSSISIAGFWIIAILLIISIVIVSNTIRVTMYNRKLEISIMKAVGATDSFIRIPFMVEGVAIGLISASLTTLLLYFLYKAIVEAMKNVLNISTVIPFTSFVWQIIGVFVGIGVVTGVFGSVFMINKYLRKEGSEFRAL